MDMKESINAGDKSGAGLIMGAGMKAGIALKNFWHIVNMRRPEGCACDGCTWYHKLPAALHEAAQGLITCRNAQVAWVEDFPNLVTTEGKNDLLTKYLKGSGYTATWFVGLVDNAGWTAYAAGDTAAKITASANPPTTNGWQEGVPYSNANRVTWTGGTAAAGSIDNSASQAAFNINATLTVRGAILDSNNTKQGTSGVLYCEGDFSAARAVLSGDTLNVTVTLTD
jgi:hypothetical protein